MTTRQTVPTEVKVFMNHVYEFKKGVRSMILHTMNRRHEEFVTKRLNDQKIPYVIQVVDENKINLFFGKAECLEAVRHIVCRPLNKLSPEEDFIIGALLGYDICQQCRRYCDKKGGMSTSVA